MSDILQDASELTLPWAIDANFTEFHRQFACLPGAEVHDDPNLMYFATPIPMGGFNGVVRASLQPGDVERKVEEVAMLFGRQGKRWNWAIGPSSLPLDLGARLQSCGLRHGGSEIAMAADLNALNTERTWLDHFSIMRVRDGHALNLFMYAMVLGFGPPQDFNEAWGQVFECLGLAEEAPLQHYLGLLNGQPVASSSVFYGAGVAGLYFISTVPQARGRGIGSAMTLAPLLDARDRGYRVGILQATEMGSSLYRRLGFKAYGDFSFYYIPSH